jgi:hypothetical protein
MAIKALTPSTRNWYVSQGDEGAADTLEQSKQNGATIFYWETLPSHVQSACHDMQGQAQLNFADNTQTIINRTAYRNREAFRKGVVGWENFHTEDGTPVPCVRDRILEGGRDVYVISDAALDYVPMSIINEVGDHVFKQCSMTDIERKNFAALSSALGVSPTSTAPSAMTTQNESEAATDPLSDPTPL